MVTPWLGRDRRRERCPLPSNAGRREAQRTSLALEADGIGRGGEGGAIPDLAGVTQTCKGGGMSCGRGKDPGEGECLSTLSLEVISSESGTSYCACPSGLFLSRGREVLSFVCSMFITQFPF